ncbi:hypothetical protein RJ55_01357 [Drechmeria coniospora]|nr:hypothetical protein RJ55_01357 [Drechmeria coniospora]
MAPETPKGVSSRLLTMKFMQRAAASASSTASPDSDGNSSKKRKLHHSPAEGKFSANIDRALIQAALDEEEAARQAALQRHAAHDTHWVLDGSWDKSNPGSQANGSLNVVYVGYGDIDSSTESGDVNDAPTKGRTSTKPDKKTEIEESKTAPTTGDDDSSDQSSEESDEPKRKRRSRHSMDNSNSSLRSDRSRSQSRPRQPAERATANELRHKRRQKDIRLNQLTSISAGGDGAFGQGRSGGDRLMKCCTCQQTGHKASDCPQRQDGRPRRNF